MVPIVVCVAPARVVLHLAALWALLLQPVAASGACTLPLHLGMRVSGDDIKPGQNSPGASTWTLKSF
jgi:hypothetical protein